MSKYLVTKVRTWTQVVELEDSLVPTDECLDNAVCHAMAGEEHFEEAWEPTYTASYMEEN